MNDKPLSADGVVEAAGAEADVRYPAPFEGSAYSEEEFQQSLARDCERQGFIEGAKYAANLLRQSAPVDGWERIDKAVDDLMAIAVSFDMGTNIDATKQKFKDAYFRFMQAEVLADREHRPASPPADVAGMRDILFPEDKKLDDGSYLCTDAAGNLDAALIDIRRLSAAGKPTDTVCIRTLERVLSQLEKARALPIPETKTDAGDR